jgi:hypothetical protein
MNKTWLWVEQGLDVSEAWCQLSLGETGPRRWFAGRRYLDAYLETVGSLDGIRSHSTYFVDLSFMREM